MGLNFQVFSLPLPVGYTLDENLMVGIRAAVVTSKTTSSQQVVGFDPVTGDPILGVSENKNSTTGFGLFARYYIPIGDDNKFFFYPDVNVAFLTTGGESSTTGSPTTENLNTNTFVIGVIPGFAYYPTTHWAIELHAGFLGLTTSKTENDQVTPTVETASNNFGLLLSGYTVGVGVSYLLQLGGS